MKRLWIVLASIAAFLLVASGATAHSFGNHNAPPSPTLTIVADPSTFVVGGSADISGTVTDYSWGKKPAAVWLGLYDGPGCNAEDYSDGMTASIAWDHHGNHGTYDTASVTSDRVGTFSVRASYGNVTACVDVTVTEKPVAPVVKTEGSVFLCYSTFQVDPGVWPGHIAAQLIAGGGYWQPYAVKGNVPFGTNIGAYHLVCNLATGQAAGQQFAGGGGDVSGPEAFGSITGNLGWYPVVP